MKTRRGMIVVALVCAVLGIGCAEKDPVAEMESMRAKYSASLDGFYTQPLEDPAAAVADEAAEGDEGDEIGADAELLAALAEEAQEGPIASRAVLTFTMRTESVEKLPGVTVDITMGNAGGDKERWTVWIDTSEIPRGPGTQITHTIEEVMYEEGDGFHVEVRHPIPEEERTTYREYADAG